VGSFLVCSQAFGQTEASGTPVGGTPDQRDKILYAEDTEHIKPLAVKLTRNILIDQKEIWTSPFHINRHNAAWWLLFGGAAAALIASDHKIENDLPTHGTLVTTSTRISQVGAPYTVIPVIGGLYIVGALTDNAKARETSMLGTEAALDSLIIVEGLKLATRRSRPLEQEGQFFDGGSSFPSGHTVVVWSVASVIASEYNKSIIIPIAAYAGASLVSVSRITARQHFASDVIIGAGIGWFTGRYVFKTHYDHAIHRRNGFTHALMHPQIAPSFAPGSGTMALGLKWGQ
jgi:membrane-associated phospholipid phosphatase